MINFIKNLFTSKPKVWQPSFTVDDEMIGFSDPPNGLDQSIEEEQEEEDDVIDFHIY